MKITIAVELDNSAFQDKPLELNEVLNRVPHNPGSGDEGTLKDSNGNTVGSWKVED